MSVKNILIKLAGIFGYEIYRYPGQYHKRKLSLFNHFSINCILDVGANEGQFAEKHLKYDYNGRVISFEPIKSVFDKLEKKSSTYKNWECKNYALGNTDGTTTINISENTESSSMLDINEIHVEAAPKAKFVKTETIKIYKLDTVFDDLIHKKENVFLKLDAQGFEMNILKGASQSLHKIIGLQIELSLVEMYKNEVLFEEMIAFLKDKGFVLYGVEPGFINVKTGRLLQMDGIFFREKININ
jgi:FkbM family methyltransferase